MKLLILFLILIPLNIQSQEDVFSDWAFVMQAEHFGVDVDSFISHEFFKDGFSRVPEIKEFLGLDVVYIYYQQSGDRFIDIINIVVFNQKGLAEALIDLFGACKYEKYVLGYRYIWESKGHKLIVSYNDNGTSTLKLTPSNPN